MRELFIDATNTVAGRLCSFVAKQALLGFDVNIFNSENAIVSGNKKVAYEKYHNLIFEMGTPQKGPVVIRLPDRFLKRMIRNMVGYKTPRGRVALNKIKFYRGIPEEFKDKKLISPIKKADVLPTLKMQTIGELCVSLGGKQ